VEVNVTLANIKNTFGEPTNGFLRVRRKVGKLYEDLPAIDKHWWNSTSGSGSAKIPEASILVSTLY
jgi:hypothetical protein